MKLLENENVLEFFVGDKSLISATVSAVHVFEMAGALTVDLDVTLLYSKTEKNFRVRFEEVVEYAFCHNRTRYFYYIINLKFFKEGNFYYISLDPDDSISSRSENDNNFILSNRVQAFLLNDIG